VICKIRTIIVPMTLNEREQRFMLIQNYKK
jgi:hypothetical protein